MVGLDDPRIGVQAADDLARGIGALGARIRDLVQDHHVGELDLVGQQMHQRALVLLAQRLAPVAQEIVAGIVAQQVHRVDHRHHRVEPRDVRQALARLVAEVEGGGDRQRLGDAGRFDQQVVEAPLGSARRRTSASRSSRRVQQMQPFDISTSVSSVRLSSVRRARGRRRCSPRTCR
jgi:hypothetical protein